MATFKVVVRKKRADGFYPVYIRVVHRSRMGYIKTDKLITDKQITKNGEIKDIVVNEYCSREILRYSDMINRKDVSNYSVASRRIQPLRNWFILHTVIYGRSGLCHLPIGLQSHSNWP